MGGVVGRNANRNPISDDNANAEPPHAAAKLCGQFLAVFQPHDKGSASAGLHDSSFKFCKIIFCHLFTVT